MIPSDPIEKRPLNIRSLTKSRQLKRKCYQAGSWGKVQPFKLRDIERNGLENLVGFVQAKSCFQAVWTALSRHTGDCWSSSWLINTNQDLKGLESDESPPPNRPRPPLWRRCPRAPVGCLSDGGSPGGQLVPATGSRCLCDTLPWPTVLKYF